MLKKLIQFSLITLLAACASGHHKTSVKLREYVMAGKFQEGIEFLKGSSLAEDEKSKLLFYTELGLLEHYQGNFEASSKALTSAKGLIDELYTTRASGKVKSFVSNDNADFYYGEKYEASLVYFYLSLNNYMLSMKETDAAKRKVYLEKARSEVVDWDSFLTEIKNERLGQALFKEDLLAKTFGALVHESQNNIQDDQIALQLYKDAQGVFFRNYNLFPTFNQSFEKFRKNFAELPDLSTKEIEGKYVLETDHNRAFKEFLNLKITFLTQRIQRKPASNEGNISFLIQDGLIAEKIPQKYEFPMQWGAHLGSAGMMGVGNKISFELPAIQGVQTLEGSRLQALRPDGSVAKEVTLSVIAPLSELAQQAINEHSASIATKTATRVATKHISALVAATATYQAGRARNNTLTMMLALAGHAAAVASINSSEVADVRFWSTLPSNIRMAHVSVPKGIYKFRAVFGNTTTPSKIIELGHHEVGDHSIKFVMSHRDLRFKSQNTEPNTIKMAEIAPETDRSVASEPAK